MKSFLPNAGRGKREEVRPQKIVPSIVGVAIMSFAVKYPARHFFHRLTGRFIRAVLLRGIA